VRKLQNTALVENWFVHDDISKTSAKVINNLQFDYLQLTIYLNI